MTPNERLSVDKLIDVKLHGLGFVHVIDPEVEVVGELVEAWNEGFVLVEQILGRLASHQMVVPERVCPLHGTTAVDSFRRVPA